MTVKFITSGESSVEAHAWCTDRCEDVLAGHLRILADDHWWFVPVAKDMPAMASNDMIEIATELRRLNGYKPPKQQDLPDLIAGSLGVSRGTAYDMMREALELADAALSGANMNMNVVQRKVKAAMDVARTTEGGAA